MDYSSLVSTALGGLIAAATAYFTQRKAAADALAAQAEANASAIAVQGSANEAAAARNAEANQRQDEGVRRQLEALFVHLQQIVWVARSQGVVDPRKWRSAQQRLLDRLANSDVAIALTDAQADSAYETAFAADVALVVVDDLYQNFDRLSAVPGAAMAQEAEQLRQNVKGASTPAFAAFERLWESFPRAVHRSEEYRRRARQLESGHDS